MTDALTIFENKVPAQQMREAVLHLQNALLEMNQANIVTTHKFLPGIYERTITIPPWTVLTGAEHKTAYRVRLEKGVIAVNTDDSVKVLVAPCEFDVEAGFQRAGRVFEEEVIWTDVYDNPDNCRDLNELEQRLYVVPECGMGDSRARSSISIAQTDYQLFLQQIGIDQQTMNSIVMADADLIQMPDGYAVELRPSQVDGIGMFALRDFSAGEIICPGRLDGKRTPAGRYINHSCHANVMPIKVGDDIYATALVDVRAGQELLVDYRASMRVNFGLYLVGEMPCLDG